MNSLQSFINHIFRITETYELNENSLDISLQKFGELTEHLLRALQYLNTSGEDYSQRALREIRNKFLLHLNDMLNDIPWKKDIVKYRIELEWMREIRKSYFEYEKFYHNNLTLYPLSGPLALNLEAKIIGGNLTFADLGLIEDKSNNKRLQFTFDFNLAIQRNRGTDLEIVEKQK
jgi:hypothetical protein